MKDSDIAILGAAGLGAALIAMKIVSSQPQPPYKYQYIETVNDFVCKQWQFIESNPYHIILNNGDSININISYNIPVDKIIDVVDVRFHNVCSTSEGYGKLYAYVNGKPALPTIGLVSNKTPIYVAFPQCPNYGTIFTTIWDTDDVKGVGTYNYTYTYEGNTPLYVKSLELYVTNKM